MQQKIQELADKIYREGVQKGEEKAGELVKDAEARAEKIIADAREQAARIVRQAEQQAAEFRKNVESETKLAGEQAISAVKQRLLDLVTAQVVDKGLADALSSPAVIKEFVGIVINNWKIAQGEVPSLELLLPENNRKDLLAAFESGIQGVLKEKLTITFSRAVKSGFQIGPHGGIFKISLTNEDFSEFFKEFLRPKTRAFLFG